jgi:Polyketide cyclase / dehydrase and lipid transport
VKGIFQSSEKIKIEASTDRVWGIIDDISLIPQYHPEVGKVDLISGESKRAVGVRYRCSILEGRKGTCVEEVVEHVPNRKISTAMPQDSWGLAKMFADFIVDTTVEPLDDNSCFLQFDAYYNPVGLWNTILNVLMLRRVFRKRSRAVMEGIKRLAEME